MIFLIRHGQTEFNLQGRLQGRRDSPLTPQGEAQAKRMAACLQAFIDEPETWRVISSPLGRTRRTAEIVCESLGFSHEIELDERLAEVDVGEWEGLAREDIDAIAPGVIGTPGWLLKTPGGEDYDTVAGRVGAWLAGIDEADGRRRLVVSHGITGRILRNVYAGGHPDAAWTASPPPQDAVFRLFGGVVGRIDDHEN